MLSDNLTNARGIIKQGEKMGLLFLQGQISSAKKYSIDEAPANDRRETFRQRPGNNLSCDLAICVERQIQSLAVGSGTSTKWW